jgi:K+-sensing histidine kinase KdpD
MSTERTKNTRAVTEPSVEAPYPSSIGHGSRPSASRTNVGSAATEPTTYFAPPHRAKQHEVETTIQLVAQSPVTTALLRSATSMMCILNEHRQIVASNAALLDSLDMTHADDVIGLRHGEAMRCIHRDDHPGGCGTGAFCRACEAAIAIVASQSTGRSVERECVISITNRKGESHDLALSVRASPFELKGERFTVLCMTDIRVQKLYQDLEHSFLHDLSNLAMALNTSTELLRRGHAEPATELVADICVLSRRLSHEIVVQRLLLSSDPTRHRVNWQSVSIAEVLTFLQRLAATHPSAQLKRYSVRTYPQTIELITDPSLLERVLGNLLVNAFEATDVGGEVQVSVDSSDMAVRFSIHNAGCLSPAVAARIFHRHFSTKPGAGRGQGTYAVRLLGERLLQGHVGFTSDPERGTEFHLELPLRPEPKSRPPRRKT